MSMIDYFKNWIEVLKIIKMAWIVMNRLNITNISLTISPLAKLFKNSYSMDFKQAIVDMVVVEDVF